MIRAWYNGMVMPSQTTSWITKHGHLCVLHVTSTDPRRKGSQDIAMFESDLLPITEPYKWRIRHGQIENESGKSLLGQITSVRKLGTTQIEPNCDFTKDNLGKRPAPKYIPVGGLIKFREDNHDWKEITWQAKNGCPLFPAMKYRSRDDWTTLNVALADGGSIDIKINKWLVGIIPTKLVYRPQRPYNQLYLLPNRVQIKRARHANDRRHGMALTAYILQKIESDTVTASRLRDRFDYRIDSRGDFIQSCNPKNTWYDTELGSVLKITLPDGFCKHVWDNVGEHIQPREDVIAARAERHGYFLVSETIADSARDHNWIMDEKDAYCSRMEHENLKGYKYKLSKFACELSGIKVSNITVSPKLTKYYEKALSGTDNRSLHRRARFENALSSEKKTSNRMYIDGKFISHRRIYATKLVFIPELNITAIDLRVESIKVGGSEK